ncbi:hypothetical protein D623_10032183 [Myotis brandtii]|uniref:Uncharacterized protein n=1 Tax=Myotis brandtii TaxID=109478 RepID=S7NF26_MYOBR|nr:hypothetical protein D623_10032183 [Myotis brandtii]
MVKKEGKDRDKERAGRSGVGKEGKKEVEEGLGCRWRAWSGNLTKAIDSPAKGGQMQVLTGATGERSPFSEGVLSEERVRGMLDMISKISPHVNPKQNLKEPEHGSCKFKAIQDSCQAANSQLWNHLKV